LKEGITIDGKYWIVKYSHGLSEYVGSGIYRILGIEAQEVVLGVRNGRLVAACKDFCEREGALREVRTLKNIHSKELSERLEECSFTAPNAIEGMMIQLRYNPVMQGVPGIEERFWQQFIVDMLINNSRSDGDWGVLYETGEYRLAPVFGNGSAFFDKVSDRELAVILADDSLMFQNVASCKSSYTYSGRRICGGDMVKIKNEAFLRTARDIIPVIENKMGDIRDFIDGIPEKYGDLCICSDVRKRFYLRFMEIVLGRVLLPVVGNDNDSLNLPYTTMSKTSPSIL
ncbi:MAG: hypothetical protein NC253_13055, partial [Ruminococcus sp.]|nr:hypothetical protein [Ruminococcus sp.]